MPDQADGVLDPDKISSETPDSDGNYVSSALWMRILGGNVVENGYLGSFRNCTITLAIVCGLTAAGLSSDSSVGM